MLGTNALGSAVTDSKRDCVGVSVVFQVKQVAVLVMIVTTSHVAIQLVTHVRTGRVGLNGQVVRPPVVLVSEENIEHVTVKISKKDTIAMDLTISPNPA